MRVSLAVVLAQVPCGAAEAQTWGQPTPARPYISPRLPLGAVARQTLSTPLQGPPVIFAPGRVPPAAVAPPIVYVVIPRVIVRPSEVTIAPPEVRMAEPSPPADPATDTDPR